MARSGKQGVEYFPLDVHLCKKFRFVEMKFGVTGFGIVIKLYQFIYDNGYYAEWNEDECLIFADDIKSDPKTVTSVIDECLKRGIFSQEMYDKHSILTSKGIQKQYQEIVKRRKSVEVQPEYLLVSGTFGIVEDEGRGECGNGEDEGAQDESAVQTSCTHDDHINGQIETEIETESKHESKLDETDTEQRPSRTPYKQIVELYHKHCTSLPKMRTVTDKRKALMRVRWKTYGDLVTYEELFQKAEESDFLSGRNGKWTGCNFDWLLNETNMVKVLEGNYDNKGGYQDGRSVGEDKATGSTIQGTARSANEKDYRRGHEDFFE